MEDKVFLDLTNIKKKSEIQDLVQEEFFNALTEFLNERYTKVRQVGNADVGVVIGKALDDDGFEHDLVVVAHGTCKHWYDSQRKFKGEVREVLAYDLDEEADLYEQDPQTIKRKERLAKRKAAENKK